MSRGSGDPGTQLTDALGGDKVLLGTLVLRAATVWLFFRCNLKECPNKLKLAYID